MAVKIGPKWSPTGWAKTFKWDNFVEWSVWRGGRGDWSLYVEIGNQYFRGNFHKVAEHTAARLNIPPCTTTTHHQPPPPTTTTTTNHQPPTANHYQPPPRIHTFFLSLPLSYSFHHLKVFRSLVHKKRRKKQLRFKTPHKNIPKSLNAYSSPFQDKSWIFLTEV